MTLSRTPIASLYFDQMSVEAVSTTFAVLLFFLIHFGNIDSIGDKAAKCSRKLYDIGSEGSDNLHGLRYDWVSICNGLAR
jgi:hypothetical protein